MWTNAENGPKSSVPNGQEVRRQVGIKEGRGDWRKTSAKSSVGDKRRRREKTSRRQKKTVGVTRGTTIARREEGSKLGDKWGTQDSNGRQKRDKEADKSETSWETKDHQKNGKQAGRQDQKSSFPLRPPFQERKNPNSIVNSLGKRRGSRTQAGKKAGNRPSQGTPKWETKSRRCSLCQPFGKGFWCEWSWVAVRTAAATPHGHEVR